MHLQISGGWDLTVCVWNLHTARYRYTLKYPGSTYLWGYVCIYMGIA